MIHLEGMPEFDQYIYKYEITNISNMLLNTIRQEIFMEFTRDYEIRLTGSEISKKKNLNQKSVSNTLRDFEDLGFLKSTLQGKNKLYYLNIDDKENFIPFISVIEHLRTIYFFKKQPYIKEIITKITPHSSGIIVIFGSYAKGTHKKDSDLDIFIAGKYDENEIDKISKVYKTEINIKHYQMHNFKRALIKKDPFLEEIIKDHILIEGIQKFVSSVRELKYGKD